MSRPHARSKKAIKRQLILDAAAFLWLLLLVVVALPILLGPVPVPR